MSARLYNTVKPESMTWVRFSLWRAVLFYAGCLLSGGILVVIFVNYPYVRLMCTTESCEADEADYAMFHEPNEERRYFEVEHYSVAEGKYSCFECNGIRFSACSDDAWTLKQIPSEPENFTERFVISEDFAKLPSRESLIATFGYNRMKIEAADVLTVSVQEILSPFYIFQYFAVGWWLYTEYVIYSVIVLFITVMSIIFCIKAKLFNLKRLHDLAGYEHQIIPYNRETKTAGKAITDSFLIPGDCFVIVEGMEIPCDSILIRGRVVVDESMLTGESVPVTKTEYQYASNEPDATKRTANILFSGTKIKVVNHGSDAIAMVYRSGFRSARGELIAALIAPKTEIVQFLPDALWAILFMVIITTAIFGWSADQLKVIDTTDELIVEAYLTALTIAVPPGLVACLSIGTSISVARLLAKEVSISDTAKLTAAGYISIACFDKTGTLTDENIDFQGTLLFDQANPHFPSSEIPSSDQELTHVAKEIMACCHSLSLVEGKVVGDPLEVELFHTSKWSIKLSSDAKNIEIAPPAGHPHASQNHVILKQFEFTPEKLRAAALISRPTGQVVFLMKGSPEMISKLCVPSTVPATLDQDLASLAKKGFRVLALAYKLCAESVDQAATATQLELEADGVQFLGLVYFSNKLKPDTFPATIQGLRQAKIHVNMITGDHFHTAAAISKDCDILKKDVPMLLIDRDPSSDLPIIVNPATEKRIPDITIAQLVEKYHANVNKTSSPSSSTDVEVGSSTLLENKFQIVISGVGFESIQKHCPQTLEPLCRVTSVFARMKPADKKKVVEELMLPDSRIKNNTTPCHVLFCGDGANDMEALSTATVGVSLCDTATTVAAAIVSTAQSPLAVIEVLKEGRCSLVTAYVLVNYNIMYAIIQLFMTCYLNNVGLVFGDYMYLIQDMFYSLFLGLCISYTGPSDTLHTSLPPQSLFSPRLLAKLLPQLGIFPLFQFITLEILYSQAWFTKFDPADDPLTESYAWEGAILNIVALAQLMIASIVVTIGEPYRKPWYTNKAHLVVLLLHTCWIMYLLFGESNEFMVGVDNKIFRHKFSGILIGIIAANVVVSSIFTKLADWIFQEY